METKRFDIITEADARVLEPGTTVRLAARGHVTPLADDTLRERRITVIGEDMRATPPGMRWCRRPTCAGSRSAATTPASISRRT